MAFELLEGVTIFSFLLFRGTSVGEEGEETGTCCLSFSSLLFSDFSFLSAASDSRYNKGGVMLFSSSDSDSMWGLTKLLCLRVDERELSLLRKSEYPEGSISG